MFVKLAFTGDKHISQMFKIITSIINDPTISTISQLNTLMTTTFTQGLTKDYYDSANSYIYRAGTGNTTLTTSNTKATFNKWSTALYGFDFMLEQTAYDSPSMKYITGIHSIGTSAAAGQVSRWDHISNSGSLVGGQTNEPVTSVYMNSSSTLGTPPTGQYPIYNLNNVAITTTTGTITFTTPTQNAHAIPLQVGQTVTVSGTNTGGGSFPVGTYFVTSSAASTAVLSTAYLPAITNPTTAIGTPAGLTFTVNGGTGYASGFPVIPSTLENTIRTAWFYITDNCFLYAFSNSTGGIVGIPAGTNQALTNWNGPHLTMQYTRVDPWNTSSTPIFPWIISNPYRINGFGALAADLDNVANTRASNGYNNLPLLAASMINAQPSATATNWLKLYNFPINLGAGIRYNEIFGLTSTAGLTAPVALSQVPSSGASQAPGLFKTAGTRWITSDLTKQSYMLLPITWRHNAWAVSGGNITDKTGIYWFNGDFFPGDIRAGLTQILLTKQLSRIPSSSPIL